MHKKIAATVKTETKRWVKTNLLNFISQKTFKILNKIKIIFIVDKFKRFIEGGETMIGVIVSSEITFEKENDFAKHIWAGDKMICMSKLLGWDNVFMFEQAPKPRQFPFIF